MTKIGNVWVFIEQEGGKIADVSLELVCKGKELAARLGVKVEAVLLGDNVAHCADTLFSYGVKTVFLAEDKRLEPFTVLPYAKVIMDLIKEHRPNILLFGATMKGRELAPRIASEKLAGLTADCTDLQIDDFDARAKEEKRVKVMEVIAAVVQEKFGADDADELAYFEECGGVVFDKRWLNKTVKERQIREEVSGQVDKLRQDFATLSVVFADPDLKAGVLAEYARSRSLHEALQAKDRILRSREIARREAERAQAEAERARREAEARAAQAQPVAPGPEPEPESAPRAEEARAAQATERVYTFTFRASHSSQQEWKALVAYMQAHGFAYEQIKEV